MAHQNSPKEIQVRLFDPHPDQRKKIQEIQQKDPKFIILKVGRQWGKSMTALNLLLKWVLEKDKSVGLWVAPIYAQSKKVFEEMVSSMVDTGLVKKIDKSDLFVRFINGSVIYFRSAERPDNLRGMTITHLVVDEAAFIKDDVWSQVLRPTTLVKGEKVLFISTPKGKNYFYELYNRGLSEDYPEYLSLHGTSFDTPFISKEELEEAQRSLPEHIYRQEILAEFIDDGGSVFTDLDKVCVLRQYRQPQPNQKYYGGIDWGRMNDYTVLTILDDQGELVYQYRERQKSWDIIVSEVSTILKQYKPQVYSEINSMGDVLHEQLRKQYPTAQPFLTTNDTKQEIIEDLIMSVNEEKIKLPNKDLNLTLYNELSQFTYEYSSRTRKIKYGAPNGLHDDTVMSLAIAYHALKKKINHGRYVVI